MVETDLRAVSTGKTIEFLGEKVDLNAGFLRLKKKRAIKVRKSPDLSVSWSLDLNVSFRLSRDERMTVNEAEVFLLPEELPVFTRALIQHPIFFPISYSQKMSMERGMHCIRLTSEEPFEDFAERLSGALSRLG